VHDPEYTFFVYLEADGKPFMPVARVFTKYLLNTYLEPPIFVGELLLVVEGSPRDTASFDEFALLKHCSL